jgi:error-prone DNA polymerase
MERFCSSLRRELPDIDIDVESARRLEIYNLVFNRYGDRAWSRPGNTSRCATVAMVDTYRARHAIRDAGAALGLPAGEIDLLAKAMPHIRARNISQALAHLPELSRLNISQPLVAMTIALAEKLDGLPRHLAMHPCAVVLSDGALLDRVPLQVNTAGYPMVEFDKDDVEAVGLLKLDILGYGCNLRLRIPSLKLHVARVKPSTLIGCHSMIFLPLISSNLLGLSASFRLKVQDSEN